MARPEHHPVAAALLEGDVVPIEQAVIGCVLLEPGSRMPPLLRTEFYLDKHALVWDAMLALDAQGLHPDCVSVEHALRAGGALPSGEPAALIAFCVEQAAINANLQHYAGLIRSAARERMKRALGHELAERGLDEADILKRLDALPGPLAGTLFDPAENWRRVVDTWQVQRIRTGFSRLDALTGGLGTGDFIVVGARSSHGKTSMLVALALRFAHAGVEVEYITLEDSPDAIVRRMVANLTSIPMRRLKDGSVSPTEFSAAEGAVRRLQDLPLTITGVDHLRSIDEATIVPAVGRATARIVMLDHLQQITTRDPRRVDGLDRVMKRLQSVSLRDGKILLLAAQLNREVEARQGPPRLSDLRDSGSIEMAARQVWLLYWPRKHDAERNVEDYELYVEKHSDGGTGLVPLRFDASCGQFDDREEPS